MRFDSPNQVAQVVFDTLFEERPKDSLMNAIFRFNAGVNSFDGMSFPAMPQELLHSVVNAKFHADALLFTGYLFAKEAWKRIVGEGGAQIGGDHQSLASLKKSKETVKRELKLFEVQFEKFYGRCEAICAARERIHANSSQIGQQYLTPCFLPRRPPSRLDKECLRMLYEYHKQVHASDNIQLEQATSSTCVHETST